MRHDTFLVINYKEYRIQASYLNGILQVKVMFCIEPAARYQHKCFNTIIGAKRAISKHVNNH